MRELRYVQSDIADSSSEDLLLVTTYGMIVDRLGHRGWPLSKRLIFMSLDRGLGETTNVLCATPFLAIAANPETIERREVTSRVFVTLHFSRSNDFMILIESDSIVILCCSIGVRTLTFYFSARFVQFQSVGLGCYLVARYLAEPYDRVVERHATEMSANVHSEVSQVVNGALSMRDGDMRQASPMLGVFAFAGARPLPVLQRLFQAAAARRAEAPALEAFPAGAVDRGSVLRVVKCAVLHEFVIDLPEAYDTPVGERRVGLSGGQRQRIGRPIIQVAHGLSPVRVCDIAFPVGGGHSAGLETLNDLARRSSHFRALHEAAA